MGSETKLSITDQQVQLVVQGLVDHLIESRDEAKTVVLTGMVDEQKIQVEITEFHIRIACFHHVNKALSQYVLA